jgi:hypothetical protein
MIDAQDRTVYAAILLSAALYGAIGVITAVLAKRAVSPTPWRLAAWVLSGIVFAAHIIYDRRRNGSSAASTALRVAAAVAVGAFLLAAAANVNHHPAGRNRSLSLALVAWPLLIMIPAFVAALIATGLLARFRPAKR